MIVRVRNLNVFERSVPTPVNTSFPIKGNETIEFEYPKAFDWFFLDLQKYNFVVEIITQLGDVKPHNPKLDFGAFDALIPECLELLQDTNVCDDGGIHVEQDELWVTEEAYDAFKQAYEDALKVKQSASTQEEVDEAVKALTEAKQTFESSRQSGTAVDEQLSKVTQYGFGDDGIVLGELLGLDTLKDNSFFVKLDTPLREEDKVTATVKLNDHTFEVDIDVDRHPDIAITDGGVSTIGETLVWSLGTSSETTDFDRVDGDSVSRFYETWPTVPNTALLTLSTDTGEALRGVNEREFRDVTVEMLKGKTTNVFVTKLNFEYLDELIKEATASLEGTVTSTDDGDDVDPGTDWVTKEQMDTFQGVLDKAKAVKGNVDTQNEINDSLTELESALALFESQKQDGRKGPYIKSVALIQGENAQDSEGNDFCHPGFTVELADNRIVAKGTLSFIESYADNPTGETHYYLPLEITTDPGRVIVLYKTSDPTAEKSHETSAGTQNLVLAVNQWKKEIKVVVYKNEANYATKTNGQEYTVSYDLVTFEPEKPYITGVSVPIGMCDGLLYSELYSELEPHLTGNRITASGKVNYIESWNAYADPKINTHYFVPVTLEGLKPDYVVKCFKPEDDEAELKHYVVKSDNILVSSITPADRTRKIVVYASEGNYTKDERGQEYILDFSSLRLAADPNPLKNFELITEGSYKGHEYTELVDQETEFDVLIDEGEKTITCTGDVEWLDWPEVASPSSETHHFFPARMDLADGLIVSWFTKYDNPTESNHYTVTEENKDIVILLTEGTLKKKFVIYTTEDAFNAKEDGVEYTLDFTGSTLKPKPFMVHEVEDFDGLREALQQEPDYDGKVHVSFHDTLELTDDLTIETPLSLDGNEGTLTTSHKFKTLADLELLNMTFESTYEFGIIIGDNATDPKVRFENVTFDFKPTKVNESMNLAQGVRTQSGSGHFPDVTFVDCVVKGTKPAEGDFQVIGVTVYTPQDTVGGHLVIDHTSVTTQGNPGTTCVMVAAPGAEVEIINESTITNKDDHGVCVMYNGKVTFDGSTVDSILPVYIGGSDEITTDGAKVEFTNSSKVISTNIWAKGDGNDCGAFVFDRCSNSTVSTDATSSVTCTGSTENERYQYVGSFYSNSDNTVQLEGTVKVEQHSVGMWFTHSKTFDDGAYYDATGKGDTIVVTGTAASTAYVIMDESKRGTSTIVNVTNKLDEAVTVATKAQAGDTKKPFAIAMGRFADDLGNDGIRMPEGVRFIGYSEYITLQPVLNDRFLGKLPKDLQRDVVVLENGMKAQVSGVLTKDVKWPEFSSLTDYQQGSYLALKAIKTGITNSVSTSSEYTNTTDNYLDSDGEVFFYVGDGTDFTKKVAFTAHTNEGDKEVALDLTDMRLQLTLSTVAKSDRTKEWDGMPYKRLVGPDFDATLEGNTIKLSGDLYKVESWDAHSNMVGRYIATVSLGAKEGSVLGSSKDDPSLNYGFGTGPNDFLVSFTDGKKTKQYELYYDRAAFEAQTPDATYVVDATACNFTTRPKPTATPVVPEGTEEFYGILAKRLQKDVKVTDDAITGSLTRVRNYPAFGGEKSDGYFLALKYESNGTKLTTTVENGSGNVTDLTEDEYCVYRVTDPASQSIKVTVELDGETSEKTYTLTGLTLIDTAELDDVVAEANGILEETAESSDGQGIEDKLWWATTEERTALTDAIKTNTEEAFKSSDDVTTAKQAIEEAIETFKEARKAVSFIKIEIPEGTVTVGGKQASELQTLQLDDHAITGNVSYVTGFTYNNKETDGQFLVLKISSTNEGAEVSSVLQVGKSSVFAYVKDGYSIFQLIQEDMSGAKLFLKQKNEGSEGTLSDLTDEYDLSGVTVEAGPELPAYILAAKGADRSQSWLGMDYSTLVGENYWARLLGTDIIAHGDLHKVTTWEQNHSADGKYCAPIDVTAKVGNVIGKADKDYKYVFEQETDTIIWQFGDNTSTQFILYNDEEDYNSKTNGNTYTVDISKCNLVAPGVDMTELEELLGQAKTELDETAKSSDGSDVGTKVWYVSKEAAQALKDAMAQYQEAFKADDQAAVEAAIEAVKGALKAFETARKPVDHTKVTALDAATEVGNKTAGDLMTDLTVSDTELTGTVNWVDDLQFGEASLDGNFLAVDVTSTSAKVTVVCDVKNGSGVILPRVAESTEHVLYKLPANLSGYKLVVTQRDEHGIDMLTREYDLSKLTLTPDQNPAPTLKVSSPADTEEFYGVQAQRIQTGITKNPTSRIAGTLHHINGMGGGFGGDEANGYFLALKFETNGTRLTTEITNGNHPGEVDAMQDKYCVYRISDTSNQVIKVKAEGNGKTTELSLSLKSLTMEPYIKSVDIAGQTESWKGVTYSSIMSPDFAATLNDDSIKFTGTLTQCLDWEAFGEDLQDKWYVVLGVFPGADGTLKIEKINGTTGTADVTTTGEDVVLAFDEGHKDTQSITIYPSNADALNGKNGRAYKLDASEVTFLKTLDTTPLREKIAEARKLLEETTRFDTGGANLGNTVWYVGSDWYNALESAVEDAESKLPTLTDETKQGEMDGAIAAIDKAVKQFNSDKRANVLFHVDVPSPDVTIGDKKVSDLQSDVKVTRDNKVTGLVRYVALEEGRDGNFLALDFNAHRDEVILTEKLKRNRDNKIVGFTAIGDHRLIKGKPGETYTLIVTQSIKGADPKYNLEREYDLSGVIWEYNVHVNSIKATKWGFAKTNAELDSLIEQGTSVKIDHDSDIFFAVYTKPEHNVIMNVAFDGVQYACICDGANGSLVGAGASTSGHASDFDYKSTDNGKTWVENAEAVDVTDKHVVMSIVTYSEDVTHENATTILATVGTTVLGPYTVDCSASMLFENAVNTIGVEKFGFLPLKASADSVEEGKSEQLTHNSNIFFFKLKNALEADGKKYAMLIKVDDKTYAAFNTQDTYQSMWVSLEEPNDAALVSSDDGKSWTAVSGPEEVFGKEADISIVKAEEDITAENGNTVLPTAKRVFGVQTFKCNVGLVLNAEVK